ncbi:MAG: pyridoxamine 5'-phosphate oxidase family protein [Solirubrobacteraceae bacterium]|jgi:nitroimidazol reductase NimA-like FMN-containing flavoprotein (pyridoxamine 5'-phosphate oxidase superfamily)
MPAHPPSRPVEPRRSWAPGVGDQPPGQSEPASPTSPASPASPGTVGPASDRVRLRRKRERGSYERTVIDAILDEALIAHLGVRNEDGRPLVIPTLQARAGDLLYLHGSVAGRTLRALEAGAPTCVTVSLIDGLVLARSAMHHSANYRSVMIIGEATPVRDPGHKLAALEAIVEHIVPGRWRDARPPTEKELKATSVLAVPIEEASAKIRVGPPVDDEEDYSLEVWAGVIPLVSQAQAPEPDPRLPPGIAPPAYVSDYRRPGGP